MNKKEIFNRYVLFIISLFISAMGVALTKKGELGVSPISSVANILSMKFSFLTLGNWLIIWNCVLIAGQIALLRKNFKLVQLLQIPLSFLFGIFTDVCMWLVGFIPCNIYPERILLVIIGTAVLGFGVTLSVIANVIMNSGEAFVKAISDTINVQFGNVKIGFDVSCVAAAVVLSLVFFDVRITGTREGTIIAALLTGTMVKFFGKIINEPLNLFIKRIS